MTPFQIRLRLQTPFTFQVLRITNARGKPTIKPRQPLAILLEFAGQRDATGWV